MDKTFNVSVRDRLAKNLSHLDYVCGNTGYMVRFDFDEEWDAYPIKTARFIESSGEHHDVAVIDNQCEFPQIMNTIRVEVGVYAGDLCTTTPAVIGARRSILSTGGDRPDVPEDIAYDKMMEAINQDAVRAETAAKKAEEKLADMQERYYTPSVSEDGDLSWEANDEEMPDVPTVNIKGVPGDPGKPGDDGYSPSVNINPIDGGHRVTVTDANGAKTFDVMNGEPGEPGVNAENDELFVVRRVNTYSADKTYEEIETAIAQRRVVMLVDGGTVFHYIRTDSDGIVFSRYYESTSNKYPGIWESRATINKNNVLSVKTFSPAKTPNPRKLIMTGAVNAEYDGSEAVTVEIPAGGEGGGTGLPTGGEPHQMLVTDADGVAKWEERTHYSESEQGIVFAETTPIAMGSGQFAVMEPIVNQPTAGNVYTIVPSGGEPIESEAFGADLDGVYMVCIGNPLFVGGENNDLPLAIAFFPESMVDAFDGVTAMIVTNGSDNIPALSVVGTVEKIHKIDPKYLPTMGASFLVNGSALGSVMNLGAAVEDETYKMGQFAFALGGCAQGYMSFAVGDQANAEGDKSFAHNGLASGEASFVANGATAKGGGAFAANSSTANGVNSASFGQSEANGDYSFAEGVYTVANARAQHVQGRYNIKDTANKYAHIVGNGTLESKRSNAHTLDWDGNGWFAGDVYTGGAGQADGKKLATEEYVQTYIDETLLGGAW